MLQPVQAVVNQMANPDALASAPYQHVSAADRIRNPHRDPRTLQAAWVRSASVREVADRLDCGESTASLWLHIYGYRERGGQELSLAERLRFNDASLPEVLADD